MVSKHDPVYNAALDVVLKAAIKQKMTLCSVVLIFAGVYASYSKWINIVISLAKKSLRFLNRLL